MRIIPLAVATLLVAGTAPVMAWTHVSGSVTRTDPVGHRLVLSNGHTYDLQSGVDIGKISAGEKVTLNTERKNGRYVVNKVTKES